MNSITISKKKYLELTRLDIPKEVRNTEARMFHYNHRGQHKKKKNILFKENRRTIRTIEEYKTIYTIKRYFY